MPETRISAQISPRTVDRSSEPMVTTTVSQTPCSRIGRNSTASRRKFCIDSDHAFHLLAYFESAVTPCFAAGLIEKAYIPSPGHVSGPFA